MILQGGISGTASERQGGRIERAWRWVLSRHLLLLGLVMIAVCAGPFLLVRDADSAVSPGDQLSVVSSTLAGITGVFTEPDLRPDSGAVSALPLAAVAQFDPAQLLLSQLVTCRYRNLSEVATGRFLRDFERLKGLLQGIDLKGLRPLRRGAGWVQIEAPYSPPDVAAKRPGRAVIRLAQDPGGGWKVEHLRLLLE
jgi:hypothetical protein